MPNYFGAIAHEQGWSHATREVVLREFIAERGLDRELGDYARQWADRENAAANLEDLQR